jgi:hypothetical protein
MVIIGTGGEAKRVNSVIARGQKIQRGPGANTTPSPPLSPARRPTSPPNEPDLFRRPVVYLTHPASSRPCHGIELRNLRRPAATDFSPLVFRAGDLSTRRPACEQAVTLTLVFRAGTETRGSPQSFYFSHPPTSLMTYREHPLRDC